MPIVHIVHRRTGEATLARRFPGVPVFDVTSRGLHPKLSPFYPHGGYPVPGAPGVLAESVEGVWQGLKVFEREGPDHTHFAKKSGPRKRGPSKARGGVRGHRLGDRLVGYVEARQQIYLPLYWRQLTVCASEEVAALAALPELVLLDYETNGDVHNTGSPLSHAALIGRFLNGDWPEQK